MIVFAEFSLDQSIQLLLFFVKSNINRNFGQKRNFCFLFFPLEINFCDFIVVIRTQHINTLGS